MRKQASEWPAELTEIPESEWPPPKPDHTRPIRLWRSRHYLAQLFTEEPLRAVEMRRLSICRVTIATDGHWEHNIPWDDLQRCKRETGHGGWYGIEIYPRDRDLVHVANMRHLWLLARPLPIGWFEKEGA